MPRTNDALSLDKAVRDPAAVVWTLVIDDHEQPRRKPGHRNLPRPITGRDHLTDRDRANVRERSPSIVWVVPQLVQ